MSSAADARRFAVALRPFDAEQSRITLVQNWTAEFGDERFSVNLWPRPIRSKAVTPVLLVVVTHHGRLYPIDLGIRAAAHLPVIFFRLPGELAEWTPAAAVTGRPIAISPDSPTVLVVNWFEELRRLVPATR